VKGKDKVGGKEVHSRRKGGAVVKGEKYLGERTGSVREENPTEVPGWGTKKKRLSKNKTRGLQEKKTGAGPRTWEEKKEW